MIALVPRELCDRHHVLPVSRAGSTQIVAMADPTDHAAIESVRAHTGMSVEPVIATEAAILDAIERYDRANPASNP